MKIAIKYPVGFPLSGARRALFDGCLKDLFAAGGQSMGAFRLLKVAAYPGGLVVGAPGGPLVAPAVDPEIALEACLLRQSYPGCGSPSPVYTEELSSKAGAFLGVEITQGSERSSWSTLRKVAIALAVAAVFIVPSALLALGAFPAESDGYLSDLRFPTVAVSRYDVPVSTRRDPHLIGSLDTPFCADESVLCATAQSGRPRKFIKELAAALPETPSGRYVIQLRVVALPEAE